MDKIKFDFKNVIFRDIDGRELTQEEFKAMYGADKNKLIANALWRHAPSAEIASICLDILKNKASEIDLETLKAFEGHVNAIIVAYPIRQPILDYINSLKKV